MSIEADNLSNTHCNRDGTDTIFAPAEYYPMFPPFRKRCKHGVRPGLRMEASLALQGVTEKVEGRIRYVRYRITNDKKYLKMRR